MAKVKTQLYTGSSPSEQPTIVEYPALQDAVSAFKKWLKEEAESGRNASTARFVVRGKGWSRTFALNRRGGASEVDRRAHPEDIPTPVPFMERYSQHELL